MDVGLSLALTILFGGAAAFQAVLLGAITRDRGGREASIISPLSSAIVVASLLAWIAFDDGQTGLPAPFDSGILMLAICGLFGVLLWLAIRGMPPWYASVGAFAGLGLALVPRFIDDLGLTLYFSSLIFGQCAAALAFDHWGWLGAVQRSATLPRIGGLTLVGIGVVLVRVA